MITDLKAFCELFYASTSIPIGYYHASPDDDCSFPSIWKTRLFLRHPVRFPTFHKKPGLFYRAVLQLLWLYKAGAC